MSSILERIFAAKREEVAAGRRALPLEAVAAAAARAPLPRDFAAALRRRRPAIIAEIKRASPSRGDLLPGLDPKALAREYARCGAAALSVLTDRHFKGSLDDLRAARAAVDLPILRKDFIFDPYQVYETRAAGGDCVLLIAAMLSEDGLRELAALARGLGLAALVEAHDAGELALAGRIGADLVGINNRDLRTFTVDTGVSERLLADYRGAALVITESGIDSPGDLRRLDAAGARAFLVGESLLRGGRPGERLADLVGALDGDQGQAGR